MTSIVYNMDCMEYMRTLPDNVFSLAIVDPPYGTAGSSKYKNGERVHSGGYVDKFVRREMKKWDNAPTAEYFAELFRVSENQIIFGGNYFSLPPTMCYIVWDKRIPDKMCFAQAELAWTSFEQRTRMFRKRSVGGHGERIHPMQKPVELYEWILKNFARAGERILDTHVGSGSSRIACYNMGFDFVGCEISGTFFEAQEQRFKEHAAQGSLFEFDGGEIKEVNNGMD